jgi:hypothetical protein
MAVIDLTTLHMTWDGSLIDAGYNLWVQNVNAANSTLSELGPGDGTSTCDDVYYLFPGVWNFEFCVMAFNGNDYSGLSNCVILPSPASGYTPAATCAPLPPHCPASAAPSEGSPAPTIRQTGGPTGVPIDWITTITSVEPGGATTTFVATLGT